MTLSISTPDGIAFFRLVAFEQALKAQANGFDIIGHGITGTKVGKRDYGLTGQAKTMLPKVTEYVAAVHTVREHLDGRIVDLFNLICEKVANDPDAVVFGTDAAVRRSFCLHLNGVMEDTALTSQDVDVLNAMLVGTLFERNAKPSVRVLFRED